MDKVPSELLTEQIIDPKRLFSDWVISRIDFDRCSGPEACQLITLLIQNGLPDETDALLKLQSILDKDINSVSFTDIAWLLQSACTLRVRNPISVDTLVHYVKNKLPSDPEKKLIPSGGIQITNLSVRLLFSKNLITPPLLSSYVQDSLDIYERLYQFMDEDTPEPTVKDCCEILWSLLDDFNAVYLPLIDALLQRCINQFEDLRENDLIILGKALVLRSLRGNMEYDISPILKEIDNFLRRIEKKIHIGILKAAYPFLGNSDIAPKQSLNYILSQEIKALVPILENSLHITESEAQVKAALDGISAGIESMQTLLFGLYYVDFVLPGKVLVEVNGQNHYTTEHLNRIRDGFCTPGEEVLCFKPSQDNDEKVALMKRFRGSDLVKIIAMNAKGYTLITVDTSMLGQKMKQLDYISQLLKQKLA